MNRRLRYMLILLGILSLGFVLIGYVSAAPRAGYTIDWYTVTSGATSKGGTLSLTGAAGQPEGGQRLQGGSYTLDSGFVAAEGGPSDYNIFLPLALRWG